MGYGQQLTSVKTILANATSPWSGIQATMDYLASQDKDYYWVGVYLLRGDTLFLGPFHGPATDHTMIPVGRGVCGTAVVEDRNQIVGDVSTVGNYLACNLGTKSEIVVLIRHPDSGAIIGQIDIDGTKLNQFNQDDERYLEQVAKLLAPYALALG